MSPSGGSPSGLQLGNPAACGVAIFERVDAVLPGHALGVPVTRLSLVSRPASAREARDWLTALLAGWGNANTRHNATLLLSEVVTNAVRHGRGGTILVAVTLSPTHLLAQVHDESANPPVRRAAGETGGWGLGLLDELSTQWGVDQHSEDGKSVWFEIDGADLRRWPDPNI